MIDRQDRRLLHDLLAVGDLEETRPSAPERLQILLGNGFSGELYRSFVDASSDASAHIRPSQAA
jgi:hypothetical protein